jgi:SanA protein
MLEDRLAAALVLYETRRCERILVSGARESETYDEVAVMQRWLEDRGVPTDALLADPKGLRTYDSMARAKRVFGLDGILVVSQDFHVPRAVYIARALGLDAVGVSAPPLHRYPQALHRKNTAREHLAQIRAWLDLHVLHTDPKVV